MSDRVVERVRRALKVWGCCPAESRPVAPCVATALALTFFVVGILVLNDDYRGPDDDLGISMVLSGLYPDGGQCLFTSAVLNGIIYQLNIAIPELNWFLVIERLAVTVAFFSFCYILLRHAPLGLSLACIGFVAYFIMPKCTLGSNFTVVAALCVTSGELCCCSGTMRRAPSSGVAGTVLVTLGFMWRALVLLLSAPFLALAFAGLLVRLGHEQFQRAKALVVRALVCMIAVGLCVGGALAFDKAVWAEPKWADWLEYNDARYALVDYPMSDYDEVRDELASIAHAQLDYGRSRLHHLRFAYGGVRYCSRAGGRPQFADRFPCRGAPLGQVPSADCLFSMYCRLCAAPRT